MRAKSDAGPFVPTENPATLKLLRDAFARNAEMDKADREAGFATPAGGGISLLLRTAITAMITGAESDHPDATWEGLALVIQAEHLARQLEAKADIVVHDGPPADVN